MTCNPTLAPWVPLIIVKWLYSCLYYTNIVYIYTVYYHHEQWLYSCLQYTNIVYIYIQYIIIMISERHKCITDCVSEYITCIKCDYFLHFKCMHAAGIIKNPWSNSNKPPAYALSILNYNTVYNYDVCYIECEYIDNVRCMYMGVYRGKVSCKVYPTHGLEV